MTQKLHYPGVPLPLICIHLIRMENGIIKITGTGVPWSKLDDLKQISTVTYTIQPGKELLIYERDNFGPFADKPEFPHVDFGFTDKVIKNILVE